MQAPLGARGGATAHIPPILRQTRHRPWPLPRRPWSMFMRWSDLAFLHWPLPASILRPLIPPALALDTFDGAAWLGVVPFRMERTRYRWAPPVPTATRFPEVNVRTYVRGADRAGVWFLSLDAASRLAVRGARWMFNLPYHHASMRVEAARGEVRYRSRRTGRNGPAAEFQAAYGATGEVFRAAAGTLEHWLTERYCLFGQRRSGSVYYMDVHHLPWPLRPGAVSMERNTLAEAGGVGLPDIPPIVHVAEAIDVWAWLPAPVPGRAA